MKNMTPDEIVAAIKETAARAAAGKLDVVAGMLSPPLWPPSWGQPTARKKPETGPEIIAAIEAALADTRRRFAETPVVGIETRHRDRTGEPCVTTRM